MTWAITGLSVGVALGASVSGGMIDRFGPSGGFTVAVAAGGAMVLLALTAQGPLDRSLRARAGAPAGEGDGMPRGHEERHPAAVPPDHDARRAR